MVCSRLDVIEFVNLICMKRGGMFVIFHAKFFNDLTLFELYEILKARSKIFLLEQNIICQDMDDIDYDSLHCFIVNGTKTMAYLRAFRDAGSCDCVIMGRVLSIQHKKGLGRILMNNAIEEAKRQFGAKKICVHSQKQSMGFYEKLGFEVVSDEYIEAGIPHITMELLL